MYRNYKAAAANLARLLVHPRGNPGGDDVWVFRRLQQQQPEG
jgi:hypothetical protein